jgi:hypothetical protein
VVWEGPWNGGRRWERAVEEVGESRGDARGPIAVAAGPPRGLLPRGRRACSLNLRACGPRRADDRPRASAVPARQARGAGSWPVVAEEGAGLRMGCAAAAGAVQTGRVQGDRRSPRQHTDARWVRDWVDLNHRETWRRLGGLDRDPSRYRPRQRHGGAARRRYMVVMRRVCCRTRRWGRANPSARRGRGWVRGP